MRPDGETTGNGRDARLQRTKKKKKKKEHVHKEIRTNSNDRKNATEPVETRRETKRKKKKKTIKIDGKCSISHFRSLQQWWKGRIPILGAELSFCRSFIYYKLPDFKLMAAVIFPL